MGLFDIFKKKKKINNIEEQVVEPQTIPEVPVQPTAEQIFSGSPQIMQSVQPVEPIQQPEPVQPVPQIVQDPVIVQQQITPVGQEQISIEPTPVVEQNHLVEPLLQEQPTNLEINFKPEEEPTLEYETGAVVEEPKPIVEQQIALNVNPDEVFEGALKYPYEENIIEEPESISASLPVIEQAPLVTPQPKIEESITPITIPEVETPIPSNEVEQPIIEKVTEIPNIPIGVQAPVNQTPIEQPIVKTIEPTPINIENIQPVINKPNVIEPVQQVSQQVQQPVQQPVQLNQQQIPVAQAQPNVVRHTKFCENCGEMIPSPTLLICPNCVADLQK